MTLLFVNFHDANSNFLLWIARNGQAIDRPEYTVKRKMYTYYSDQAAISNLHDKLNMEGSPYLLWRSEFYTEN